MEAQLDAASGGMISATAAEYEHAAAAMAQAQTQANRSGSGSGSGAGARSRGTSAGTSPELGFGGLLPAAVGGATVSGSDRVFAV